MGMQKTKITDTRQTPAKSLVSQYPTLTWGVVKNKKRTKALLSDAAGHGVCERVGVLLPEGVAHGPQRGED